MVQDGKTQTTYQIHYENKLTKNIIDQLIFSIFY